MGRNKKDIPFIELKESKPKTHDEVEVLFDNGTTCTAYRHSSDILGIDIWIDEDGYRIMHKEAVAWRDIVYGEFE